LPSRRDRVATGKCYKRIAAGSFVTGSFMFICFGIGGGGDIRPDARLIARNAK
jgi:hypothetical protein